MAKYEHYEIKFSGINGYLTIMDNKIYLLSDGLKVNFKNDNNKLIALNGKKIVKGRKKDITSKMLQKMEENINKIIEECNIKL